MVFNEIPKIDSSFHLQDRVDIYKYLTALKRKVRFQIGHGLITLN